MLLYVNQMRFFFYVVVKVFKVYFLSFFVFETEKKLGKCKKRVENANLATSRQRLESRAIYNFMLRCTVRSWSQSYKRNLVLKNDKIYVKLFDGASRHL